MTQLRETDADELFGIRGRIQRPRPRYTAAELRPQIGWRRLFQHHCGCRVCEADIARRKRLGRT